jgi:hypothetical protein
MESSEKYYSRTWEISSIAYKERGFYKWCIERITKGVNILEIGTGIGITMLDLIEAGFVVSSLEDNLFNYEKSKKRLVDSGKKVNYLMSITEARQKFGENNLIRSNFITEWNEVVNVVKYDTVICWFVGVHHNAHENPELIELGYDQRDFGHYRHLIYNRIFQVISLRLPVGGIISLIERVGLFTADQLEQELKEFGDDYELEKYGLKLEKIEQLPIGDITKMPGIKMVAVKEGATPIEESTPDAAFIAYTIIKFKDVSLS